VEERGARRAEWRTAPFWGVGLTRRIIPSATFLYDGRDRFLALPRQARNQLLAWLGQL
jgi:CxxC motif-containing protein (DUF1111 family)